LVVEVEVEVVEEGVLHVEVVVEEGVLHVEVVVVLSGD
jgi:hypothetical protein